MQSKTYDLIVIGTGPAGEKGAVKAAYFGYKVAIIEKEAAFGGAETQTGTLPSKTLKETALFLSGKHEKGLYGIERGLQREASIGDFMFRKNVVSSSEAEEIIHNLERHKVDIYRGTAAFEDAHTLRVQGKKEVLLTAPYILIATGSYPFHPPGIPFDGIRVHDSDTILNLTRFPNSLCIVGAGVIGCEYATIFSTIGTKVYLINDKTDILPHVDREVSSALVEEMRASGIQILFNNSIKSLTVPEDPTEPISALLANGEAIRMDMFLFAAGRSGHVRELNLEKIGLHVDKRETIVVDSCYRTAIPHIFAAGDVIGFPALASTSMDQGRVAVAYMFNTADLKHLPTVVPYGIYTVPEVSQAGITEEMAIQQKLPYCIGRSRYKDMPRGKIMGAKQGFLKLVFDRATLQVLGVHIIGPIASELIHYGMELISNKRSLYDIIGTVFNYPTLHDLYKYAAYDGLGNLSGHKVKE